ncbi:MAG: hypothetical protein GX111_01385 [Clostridiales bacterium]|nr:hypothetical protein [Clostridiales bacterium]
MICCVVAACFILRYLVKWEKLSKYLGFEQKKYEEDRYGYYEYCELDAFDD